jgi:hypothetical protein
MNSPPAPSLLTQRGGGENPVHLIVTGPLRPLRLLCVLCG